VERFLKNHWGEIQSNPLAVYHLFALTPKSTIFQKFYTKLQSFPHIVVTKGLEDDWPTRVIIKPHNIIDSSLSPDENWFATSGNEANRPVYGLWNVELADGETYTHPCGSSSCWVPHVSFHERDSQLYLQTFCICGLLCLWNPSTSPPMLLEETRLDFNREYVAWSMDGSKSVTRQGPYYAYVYALWRRDSPQHYAHLREGGDQWLFSPGAGNKLACYHTNLLNVWDCKKADHLFSKEFDGNIRNIGFTPDAKAILIGDQESVQCVSSEDGTTTWQRQMPLKRYCKFIFFHFGENIAVETADGVDFVSLVDGCPLVDRYRLQDTGGFTVNVILIHPEDEQMAILLYEYAISRWNPFNHEEIWELRDRIEGSTMNMSFYMSWKHHVMMQRNFEMACFYFLPVVQPQIQQKQHFVSRLLLSPNGKHALILSERHNILVCDTTTGDELLSYDLSEVDKPDCLQMEFTLDSASIFIWNKRFLGIIDISESLMKTFEVDDLAGAAFLDPSPPPFILLANCNGEIYSCSKDGSSRNLLCYLSIGLSYFQMPRISPDGTVLAIWQAGILVIKVLSENGRETHWPGACIDIMFTPDSGYLIVLEQMEDAMIVSLLKSPGLDVYYRWSRREHFGYFNPTLPDYAFHDDKDRWTEYYRLMDDLEPLHLNKNIPVMLHKEGQDWIRYCQKHLLRHLRYLQRNRKFCKFVGNKVAWTNQGHANIADMSLFSEHAYVCFPLFFLISLASSVVNSLASLTRSTYG
jgi:hypothetical protein